MTGSPKPDPTHCAHCEIGAVLERRLTELQLLRPVVGEQTYDKAKFELAVLTGQALAEYMGGVLGPETWPAILQTIRDHATSERTRVLAAMPAVSGGEQ